MPTRWTLHAMTRILSVLALLSMAAAAQDSAPDLNDPTVLWGQSTLYRDEWGVPHVYAESLRSMAFAFGYAQAEDHLEPMLLAYRAVNGRSAEVLGEARLAQDTYAIQMRFGDLAREAISKADDDVRDLCEGFALGVNTWILEHPDGTPPWAEGVEPQDVLALLHAFLMAHAPFDLPEADVRDRGMLSAHAWAVAASHSATNEAMLVINPHAEFEGIYRWYEAHLSADGYDVAGATVYGLPLLLMGHTPRLGWALAPNAADIADLYDEETFRYIEKTEEYHDVYVKVGDGLEKRTISTWRSEHGPIVATNMGRPLAWKIGGYGEFETLGQLLDMGWAEDFEAFGAALDIGGLPSFNVVYADTDGTIYYAYNAVTGLRPDQAIRAAEDAERTVWERPVPGNSGSFTWGDPVRAADLPELSNPESGYIIGSGTPPLHAATGVAPSGVAAPAWLVRDANTPHSARLRQMFDRGPRSFRDLQSMLFDPVASDAERGVNFLLEAAEAFPQLVEDGHPDLPAALDALAEWDFLADTESEEFTYYHIWASILAKRIDALESVPELAERQRIALQSASDAARLIVNTYQTPFVRWGDVHVIRRGDIEFPLAGGTSGDPVFRSDDIAYAQGQWVAESGYAYAMIVRFSDPPSVISLVPFGASDVADSAHYADQMPLLSERRMKVFRTTRDEVIRGATSARGSNLEFLDGSGRVRVRVEADSPISGRMAAAGRFDRASEEGLAAYSPYVEPVIAPADVAISIELEFSIPDELCAADDLDELGVYAYHPETGWAVVEDQETDRDSRSITARDFYDRVYVVLGPEIFARRDPLLRGGAAVVASSDDSLPVQLLSEESRSPRRIRPAAIPEDDELAEALGGRPSREAPEIHAGSRPGENPFGASPGVLVYTPAAREGNALPGNGLPEISKPELVPDQAAGSRAAGSQAAESRVAESREEMPDDVVFEPGREAESVKPGSVAAAAEPANTGSSSYERDEVDGETVVIRGRSADDDTPLESFGSSPRVSVSYESPSELSGDRAIKAFQLYLAPESSKASELRIGKVLDLNPPVEDVLIKMYAQRSVRAQSFLEDKARVPLPEGLAAFTPVVSVRRESKSVPCTVAITMRVAASRVDGTQSDRLTLYVYDEQAGWLPLPGTKEPAPLSYQGIDSDARTYAVLGPAELQRD